MRLATCLDASGEVLRASFKKLGFSHMSAGLATRLKTSGLSKHIKKLLARAERSSRRPAEDHGDRDLVPRRGAHRREERARREWAGADAAASARRSTLRKRLPLRRDLPGARGRRRACEPFADTEAMQLHLEEISRHVAEGAHAALLLDRAGWHTTTTRRPRNITPIFLPSRAPELNPVENILIRDRGSHVSSRNRNPFKSPPHHLSQRFSRRSAAAIRSFPPTLAPRRSAISLASDATELVAHELREKGQLASPDRLCVGGVVGMRRQFVV